MIIPPLYTLDPTKRSFSADTENALSVNADGHGRFCIGDLDTISENWIVLRTYRDRLYVTAHWDMCWDGDLRFTLGWFQNQELKGSAYLRKTLFSGGHDFLFPLQ